MSSRATPLRAVVFDLDGTLIDSLSALLEAIRDAVGPYGPRPPLDLFARVGGPPESFLPKLVTDPQHAPLVVRRLAEFNRDNAELMRPFDGVHEMLEELRSLGLQLAIWSGRDRISAEGLLRHHGLAEFFTLLVCGDDLRTHKPEAEGMRVILAKLGLEPASVIFVGDADVDVFAGVAAGVDTVIIQHARLIAPELLERCWRVAVTPREAYALIRDCARAVTPPPHRL